MHHRERAAFGPPFRIGDPGPKFYSDPISPSHKPAEYQTGRLNAMTELMDVGTGEASEA